ncbi:HNH endonuclease [Metabacillus bambusae]|uniref:HNH endonuclease n=1 Tax=Metabacillus bambusae TaxID=2795218 RepID=A0ABS3N1S1_9BACI|nr:HNH endonuclease [Metabacillus bambusae]MBO1511868.1 HNH endonuclease [Metabacillus bambusae]
MEVITMLKCVIIEESNFICFYYGEYGDTIDHIVPKSKGGLTNPKNCVCACFQCNQLKNDKLIEEFIVR